MIDKYGKFYPSNLASSHIARQDKKTAIGTLNVLCDQQLLEGICDRKCNNCYIDIAVDCLDYCEHIIGTINN